MNPEAIEAAARAMAILDDHDGCFLEVDQWEGQEDWEREAHPDNYPGMAYEDCNYWRGKARAALEAAAPYLIREARAAELEAAAERFDTRSETLLKTMQNMVGHPDTTADDVVRYGAYSAESQTTAHWLRSRAAAIRAGEA